jgi:hypothetical protein
MGSMCSWRAPKLRGVWYLSLLHDLLGACAGGALGGPLGSELPWTRPRRHSSWTESTLRSAQGYSGRAARTGGTHRRWNFFSSFEKVPYWLSMVCGAMNAVPREVKGISPSAARLDVFYARASSYASRCCSGSTTIARRWHDASATAWLTCHRAAPCVSCGTVRALLQAHSGARTLTLHISSSSCSRLA